jgi:hypothetical protein
MILKRFRNNIKSKLGKIRKRFVDFFHNARLAIDKWVSDKRQIFETWYKKQTQKINSFYLIVNEGLIIGSRWIVNKTKVALNYIFKLLKQLPFHIQEFNYFAKSGKSWPLYFVIMLLSFFLCNFRIHRFLSELINLNFYSLLSLNISINLAFDLIESSIGVIATIFSIAFVIVGFLISNLRAYKEDTYDMIYRNIKLFPTLYISLTTIGFLIILSLFRESFNPNTFINIVVWGIVLIILTLFMIGNLFSKVIEHIKPKNVYNYYFLEIKKIATKVHHNFKIEKNRRRLDEMKVGLEERLVSASGKGDIDSLNHILSVYEEISQLDI